MQPAFQRIGLIGKHRRGTEIAETLQALITHLAKHPVSVVLEAETAKALSHVSLPVHTQETLHQHCDLVIVVGGDGSLLNAARAVVQHNIPVLGINRGRLGFLTDIKPDELSKKLDEILAGRYQEESRFLLAVEIEQDKGVLHDTALNDIVLMPGAVAHMIEFSISIDDAFVSRQRADGLIVATPTGSTAYALSGGGPILHPQLDAVALVPMFPHTLSSRPIVVSSQSDIHLTINTQNETSPSVSCDGRTPVRIPPGGVIRIRRHDTSLRLIHPMDYHYFATLRDKLHWHANPT